MANFRAGQFIRFTYERPPEALDEASGDKFKEIFVLNPQWLGEVHGIDLKRLTVAEREVLATVFDPTKVYKKGVTNPADPTQKTTAIQLKNVVSPGIEPLVSDIMRRMNPRQEITNPMAFYQKFVKPFLRNKDAYRRYKPSRMRNVTISRQTTVTGSVKNPKPLFHKVESKPQPTAFKPTPTKPGSEHGQGRKLSPAEIQAMAQKMGVKVASGPAKAPLTQAQRNAAARTAKKKGKF